MNKRRAYRYQIGKDAGERVGAMLTQGHAGIPFLVQKTKVLLPC